MLWLWITELGLGIWLYRYASIQGKMGRPAYPKIVIGAAVGVLITLTALAREGGRWTGGFSCVGRKDDYYNLLVEGFMHGHLYLPVVPDPRLASTDPLTRHIAPYLQDAALFKGRYYLYYGIVPAGLILLPYRALTGADLSLNIVTLMCCAAGFGWSLATFELARRRFFPAINGVFLVLLVLVLGLGPGSTFLVRRSMFYEVPAAAGYACAMAGAFFLFRAYAYPKVPKRSIAWASLCLGLAVGCRPNYLLALPAVLLMAWWSLRNARNPLGKSNPGFAIRMFGAAVCPALCVGIVLAWYNWARFGAVGDFGFGYGVNSFFEAGQSLFSLA